MATNCQGDCTSTCVYTCSNLCDNVCKALCNNGCTSSCQTICGGDCDSTCIDACKSSSMSTSKIRTYLDHASMRKVSTVLTPTGDGIFIYPGLSGKFTVHRVTDERILERLSVALYDRSYHGSAPDNSGEDITKYKPKGSYSIEEIQRVLYNALIKALPETEEGTNEFMTVEDILYIIFHDHNISLLYQDIQNWSWNNYDSYNFNTVKKPDEPEISYQQ